MWTLLSELLEQADAQVKMTRNVIIVAVNCIPLALNASQNFFVLLLGPTREF